MIKSVPAWLLDYQLVLTDEETQLIQTYRESDRWLCKFIYEDGKEGHIDVAQAVKGYKGHCFKEIHLAHTVRDLLIEGCGQLRDHLRTILEIRSGGGEQIIEIPLYPQQSAQPPAVPHQAQAQ